MKGLVDTHAHLDFPDFSQDFAQVLLRAENAGVKKIISIGTCLESSRSALALASRHAQIHAAAGIHPCYVDEERREALGELQPLLGHPKTCAIGECGLDYHHLPPRKENENDGEYAERLDQLKKRQAEFFRGQLDLASRNNLNVVVHQRDSWNETLAILREYTGRLKAVFHCFGGTPGQAAEVIALGHLVSFTGIVSFKNAGMIRETVRSLPAGTFMIETDCPYLAPVPHRGKRCEPAYVRNVFEMLLRERATERDTLEEELWETTHSFFRLPRS